jgi:hypothetical protein
MLRNSAPLNFSPHGLSDALDGTNVFAGAMAQLVNLIPDPSTGNLWQCRPAQVQLNNLSGAWAGTNTFVSCLFVFGNRAYGMVATTNFSSKDAPFSYNLLTNTFDTITGATTATLPTSPATTGAWSPPTMALIGTKLIVTHPGFTGGANGFVGQLDITTPTAPVWSSGNLSGQVTFSQPPTWVEQFNGRAYYLVNPPNGQPVAIFSDSLSPLTTNNTGFGVPVLEFGDNQPLTAAAGLPLFNQLGGIIQSLMVFKGSSNIYQVTGDVTTSNLAINSLNVATGTLAPNSVTSTPKGLAFVAPDGLRLIDFYARVGDPLGVDGDGVNVPFIFAVVPSRINASCNFNVMRVSVQNGNVAGTPNQEYWYDISRQKWSGPHTLPPSMIAPYQNTFIVQPIGQNGLWQTDVTQNSTSSFVENGQQLTWAWQTCLLPDVGQMCEFAMVETTLKMAISSSLGVVNAYAENQNGTVLDSVTVPLPTLGSSIWGSFTWGVGSWGAASANLYPQQLQWHEPIVFQRLSIMLQGNSAQSLKIGDLYLRYEKLGYLGAAPLVAT